LVTVTVVVKNEGNAKISTGDAFYVDYFNNLSSEPAMGTFGDYAEELNREIAPNDTIHVTFNISNNAAESWHSYLIVDTDEIVAELDETNNIVGAYSLTWQALPAVSDINIAVAGSDVTITWTYPISANSYKIYRTTDPYDFSGATTFTSNIKRYIDTIGSGNTKYFYVVTAVKNYPPVTKRSKTDQDRRKEINHRK